MAVTIDLAGRSAIVFGVTNHRSIAWAIAQCLHEAGAHLTVTYQNERLGRAVLDLVKDMDRAQVDVNVLFPTHVSSYCALRDVGPVTFPAYSSTEASLRSLADDRELDLTDLIQAAEANTLRDLIFPTSDEPEPGDPHSSIVRHPGTYR